MLHMFYTCIHTYTYAGIFAHVPFLPQIDANGAVSFAFSTTVIVSAAGLKFGGGGAKASKLLKIYCKF